MSGITGCIAYRQFTCWYISVASVPFGYTHNASYTLPFSHYTAFAQYAVALPIDIDGEMTMVEQSSHGQVPSTIAEASLPIPKQIRDGVVFYWAQDDI